MNISFNLLDTKFRRMLQGLSKPFKPSEPWRVSSIAYTLDHKLAVIEREHYVYGRYSLNMLWHDCDKFLLYANPKLTYRDVCKIHVKTNAHHFDYTGPKKVEDLMQTFIDCDCCRLTKPDKPLLSFETFVHYSGKDTATMLPVCLAIVPDTVTTTILDLPPQFHGDTSYIFKTPESGKKAFNAVKETIQSVMDNLPKKKRI